MIQTLDLTKEFGKNKAVDTLNLTVKGGEFFTFLGPNAAGKTTTIKMLVGLLKPTSGRSYICGFDIEKEPVEAKRCISYVPDFPYLYEKLTGIEYLEFVGGIYELDRKILYRDAERFLNIFNIMEAKDRLIENYSHGMKQKLVMCGALLHDPQVIIIDEPMVGLDPKSARVLKDVLKARTKNGKTVFMSTHTLSVAEEVADKIAIIDQGRIIASGSLDEINSMTGDKSEKLEKTFLRLTQEVPEQDIKD